VIPVFWGWSKFLFLPKTPPGENSRLGGLCHFSINDVQTLRYLVSSHRDAVGNPGGGSPVKGGARGGDFSHYLRMVFKKKHPSTLSILFKRFFSDIP